MAEYEYQCKELGVISIEKIPESTVTVGRIGIKVDENRRKVWVCIDGQAFLRFSGGEIYEKLNLKKGEFKW